MNERDLRRIGEEFGQRLRDSVMGGATVKTMDVVSVDRDFAYCRVYSDDDPLPVPLQYLRIGATSLRVVPAVESTVGVGFANGSSILPFFVTFSEISEFVLKIGETTIKVTDGLVEFNGGGLGGLVMLNELTDKLNGLVGTVNSLVQDFNLHMHLSAAVGATTSPLTAVPGQFPAQQAQRFNATDYENEKITQ